MLWYKYINHEILACVGMFSWILAGSVSMCCMQVKHERLELLKHPLICRYINYKWWKLSFPLFLTHLLVYAVFLIFLISFCLVLPRPAPDSAFCEMSPFITNFLILATCCFVLGPSNDSTAGYTRLNFQGKISIIYQSISLLPIFFF